MSLQFSKLLTVSLSQLLSPTPTAALSQLQEAAEQGVFYLDLRESEDLVAIVDVDRCFSVAKEVYATPANVLSDYDIDKIGPHKLDGYKPLGRNAGIAKGRRDGFEAFMISRNGLCLSDTDQTPSRYPDALTASRPFMRSILNKFHHVGEILLNALCIAGDLAPATLLASRHRPDQLSTSALGMLRYPRLAEEDSTNIGHGAHTDVGSITILFTSDYGLQFQAPNGTTWEYVQPREGCAVVNIGDSVRFMSGLRFASCLHRVAPIPGQSIEERYSLAYFMRPEYDAELVDAAGRTWRSIDWHAEKYRAFRASISEQERSSVMTGKRGYAGLWAPGEATVSGTS